MWKLRNKKKGFCILPYERKQHFALSRTKKPIKPKATNQTKKTTKPNMHTKTPLTIPYNPGGFKTDFSSIVLFSQLLSALREVTFSFYHLKYHKFSSGICGLLVLRSFNSCEADILAFTASVQIVRLLQTVNAISYLHISVPF